VSGDGRIQGLPGTGYHKPEDRLAVYMTDLATILDAPDAGRSVRHLAGGRQPAEPL